MYRMKSAFGEISKILNLSLCITFIALHGNCVCTTPAIIRVSVSPMELCASVCVQFARKQRCRYFKFIAHIYRVIFYSRLRSTKRTRHPGQICICIYFVFEWVSGLFFCCDGPHLCQTNFRWKWRINSRTDDKKTLQKGFRIHWRISFTLQESGHSRSAFRWNENTKI